MSLDLLVGSFNSASCSGNSLPSVLFGSVMSRWKGVCDCREVNCVFMEFTVHTYTYIIYVHVAHVVEACKLTPCFITIQMCPFVSTYSDYVR